MKKSEVWLQIVVAKSKTDQLSHGETAAYADNLCNKFEERFGFDLEDKKPEIKKQPAEKNFG